MASFIGHLQQMMQDGQKRRELAAQGAVAQLERHRPGLLQAMMILPQDKADEAIDRVAQLIETDIEGLWVRVEQDMSVFRDYCYNLSGNLGRDMTEQESAVNDQMNNLLGEGIGDLQDWYRRRKDSMVAQAKCRELPAGPSPNSLLLPPKLLPGQVVQQVGGGQAPPPLPSYT